MELVLQWQQWISLSFLEDFHNFLDVGGTVDKERVAEAFKIILSDEKVKSVLINIFGGIVRCDVVASGIVSAVSEVGVDIPVIVRLKGNNSEEAKNSI